MSRSPRPEILIIDDRDDLLRFCQRALGEDLAFRRASSAAEAQSILAAADPGIDAVLLDRDFSRTNASERMGPSHDARNEGLHILRWLRREHPGIPVLMVSGFRDQAPAIEAAELGTDFLGWQDVIEDPNILKARLFRILETSAGPDEGVLARFRELGIVVASRRFAQTLLSLHRAAPSSAPVLLLGETGTGKDSLAFALHTISGDSARPYVSVNVAGLNPGLIESELFGHSRGAFTSADRAAVGKLRAANGGTLLLNEVGDLSLEIQTKLLSALERDEVVPVGDVRSHPARFRLIAATSRDLVALVEEGRFRRDLFHRIAWHTIEVPPLRERREEIPLLIRAFLRAAGQGTEGGIAGIAKEAVDFLCTQPWPGNVRELKAVVEAAGAIATYIITLKDVREVMRRHEGNSVPMGRSHGPAQAGVHECEDVVFGGLRYREVTARYFDYLFRQTGGRLPQIARLARISKTTAYEWRDKFGPGKPPRAESGPDPRPDGEGD